jgi:alkanesulfonate monooxygenase SsuD/methylene tetrahydromethanopterin reductase-like flavin-dependent oxidoreductase (luciferase family)
MKFALFYEIPVARPWDELSEWRAYKNVLEQAILADALGFDSFWTVEHHFLEEFSHCSNPEVLYGAIASRTRNIRLGYGVRLMPAGYNHPVRSAESAAVLDLLSDGRVEFGTGRSSTRSEIEGFRIDPGDTRDMWLEAIGHVVGCWTNDEHEFEGKFWSMPRRRVQPKPLQQPHPPIWGATASEDGHRMMGRLGLGLLSFSVGTPPEQLKIRIDMYRQGIAECAQPIGKFVNDRAAAFTMVHCAPTTHEACDVSRESIEWYPRRAGELIRSLPEWIEEMKQDYGTYEYLARQRSQVPESAMSMLSLELLRDIKACIVGDPGEVMEACRAYEAAGCDLLLCLVNPYNIPHDKVMQSIELIGKHVLPEFS